MSFLTFKFRVKDKGAGKILCRHAIACNQVWNFCVATQREAERRRRGGRGVFWPTAYDLIKLATGSSSYLGIHSDTVQTICRQFVRARDQHRKCPRFRSSYGAKRSLGWIPFIPRAVTVDGASVIYLKRRFRIWKSREIEGANKSGSFVQDARGRWYITFQNEVAVTVVTGGGAVGIDLGLKRLATLSTGETVPAVRHYRKYEADLSKAHRARNKTRAQSINAKIANARRHHLHEQSTQIVRKNRFIVVGNVGAAKLAKTKMAKSVLDAGWSAFRHMLRYKAARRQAVYVEADERWTSQTCSCCGVVPRSSPKGMSALGIRSWVCSSCGASHDRDVNAARNILKIGLECQPPAEGISV